MNLGSVWCRFLYLPLPLFLAKKRIITLRSLLSEGRFCRWIDTFRILLLSLVKFYRYFRRVATFETVTVEWIHLLSIRPEGLLDQYILL